jgi:hypothetical protein
MLTLGSAATEVGNASLSTDKVGYETSLWRFLGLLEAQVIHPSAMLEDRVIATDIALTYARLADVASAQGLGDKSRYLLAEAEKQCPIMGLRECSQAGILQLARSSIESVVSKPASDENGPNE